MAKRRNDSQLINMLKNLRDGNTTIKAGIFKENSRASRSANGSRADNLAYRLAIHDQGLGNNPERQVMQPAIEQTIKDVDSKLKAHLKRLYGTTGLGAAGIGRRFSDNIKLQFKKTSPAKKESTIRSASRRYGGGRRSTNLIQTGEMRNAVSFKVIKR